MTNPVSFGSTYKAYVTRNDAQEGKYTHPQLTRYLDRNNIQYTYSFIDPERTPTYFNPYKTDKSSQYVPSIDDYAVSKYTITAPDDKDIDIETILANHGIKFEKIDTEDVLNKNAILDRIAPAPKGYVLANINSEKLEELIENQDSNFEHCKNDYDSYFREQTDFLLKSGDKITPQTLSIRYLDDDSTPESLRRYVERFGKNNLNPDSISIYQEQRGDRTDINTYYGLKDLGFKKIPVYMDKDSYKNAQALGLLD